MTIWINISSFQKSSSQLEYILYIAPLKCILNDHLELLRSCSSVLIMNFMIEYECWIRNMKNLSASNWILVQINGQIKDWFSMLDTSKINALSSYYFSYRFWSILPFNVDIWRIATIQCQKVLVNLYQRAQ